jgi:uncharacterized protein (TIGR02145 family)
VSGVTYTWSVNPATPAGTVSGTGNGTYTVSGASTGTKSVTAVAANASCTSTRSSTVTAYVVSLPTIALASGSTAQTVTAGSAIAQIKYNTANATGATPSNLPTGVSGAWSSNVYTISGTPSATGTFGYTVTTANSNGCANATASGTITVMADTPRMYSTNTWVYGSQTWSDRIVGAPSGCTQSNNLGNSTNATLYKVYDGRYYYTWACVNNQSTLCPSPWRVPSLSDFNTLVNNTNSWTLASAWGYGGYAYFDIMGIVNSAATYWSSSEYDSSYAYYLNYDNSVLGVDYASKPSGFQVRCVK